MSQERRVGLVVAGGLALLLLGVMLVGKVRLGVSGYPITAQFKFVNNLKVDAPIRFAGGPIIGHVRAIDVAGDLVAVTGWIDRGVKLRQDCRFWIFTTGMLGEMYLEVDASESGTAPYLAEGATVRGIDPISVDATIERAGKIIDAIYPIFANEDVATSVKSMVTSLTGAAKRIAVVVDRHAGRVDQALTDLEAFSRGLERLGRDLDALGAGLKDLTDQKNPESVHAAIKHLNDTMASIDATTKTVSSIMQKMDQGKGALGTLLNDEELAKNLKALVKKLKDEPITAKVRLF